MVGATVISLLLLRYAGLGGNIGGLLLGILGSPLLLIAFLVGNKHRSGSGSGSFGDWRFLPSQQAMSIVATVGWVAGFVHTWSLANEITRSLAEDFTRGMAG